MLVHCFSHRLELAIQDAFNGTFFDEIDLMLRKIYYLYNNSPKRLHELKEFGRIFEKTVQKPSKSAGRLDCTQSQGNGNNSCQLRHFYGLC